MATRNARYRGQSCFFPKDSRAFRHRLASMRSKRLRLEPLESRLLLTTNYAVLFSGGGSAASNWPRYYNATQELYETLRDDCGLAEENIFVLFADGTDIGSQKC